jgi:hypothetical protein
MLNKIRTHRRERSDQRSAIQANFMHSEVASIFWGIAGRRRTTLWRARTGDPQLSIISISRSRKAFTGMQAENRGKPNEHAIGDERDIADDGQDTQKSHILGHER